MASYFLTLFTFIVVALSTTSAGAASKGTTTKHSHHHLPPPQQQQQLTSIIDAIIGAGDFNNWADLLGKADPSMVPITVTFLIPDDNAFLPPNDTTSSTATLANPLLFTYHLIPRRYSFSDLRQFPTGTRLPTLLPENTVLITNNSATNFTIDGAAITHPDLFHNAVVSVHGIGSVLNYTLFGKETDNNNNSTNNEASVVSSSSSSSSLSSSTMGVNQAWKSQGSHNTRSNMIHVGCYYISGNNIQIDAEQMTSVTVLITVFLIIRLNFLVGKEKGYRFQ